MRRSFGSDNAATVHPSVLEAIIRANHGHAPAYGHDPLTERLRGRVCEVFGGRAEMFLVWGGTAANVLGLRAACRPWEAVICAETAHLNLDEGGAPEAIAGIKLLSVPTADGKLTRELVEPLLARVGDEHAVQPRVLSVTQSTELGTVYTVDELRCLIEFAHFRGLLVQLDGARLANAAATLGVSLAALSSEIGIDVVSFGGTKNGLLGGEAVIVFDARLASGMPYLRKQSMQLASKMRFLSAQFEALLQDELWRHLAAHANGMAGRLAARVHGLPGLRLTRPVQANAVFAILPRKAIRALQQQFQFYLWDEATGEVRWMCSWDTRPQDVDAFAAAIADALAAT